MNRGYSVANQDAVVEREGLLLEASAIGFDLHYLADSFSQPIRLGKSHQPIRSCLLRGNKNLLAHLEAFSFKPGLAFRICSLVILTPFSR